jgi:Tol biopolymer transport system component
MLAFLLEPAGHNGSKELWVVPVSADGRAVAPPTSIQLPSESFEPLTGWSAQNKIGLIIETPTLVAIYTVPASGGNATQLTPVTSGYAAFEPRWSPDGKTIWFRVGFPPALGYVPAGGGKISTVPTGSNKGEKSQLPEAIESIPSGGNAVSPDGTMVVFAGMRSPHAAGPYLWTIPVAGGEPVQLTKDPGDDHYPCWFPDGKTVAFLRDKAIYTVSVTGGELRQITSASEAVAFAGIACSPDGQSVAYFGDDRTLRIKPLSGGEARIVTKVAALWRDCEISWSPDGNRIAYSAGSKIWIVSSGGGAPEEVKTALAGRHTNLAWSPDGKTIAFSAVQGGEPELWLMEDFLPLVQAKR